VTPPCPYAHPGGCGGCDWQHTPPAHSRELKAAVVAEQLRRLAGIEREVTVEPVSGDEDGLRWRTRVEFAVDAHGRAGLRPHRSHEVIPVEDCLIATRGVVDSGVLAGEWDGCSAVDTVAPGGRPPTVTVPVPRARSERRGMPVPSVREQVTTRTWSGELEVGARGFWQVHVGAAATFVEHVLAELSPREGERALDLYCGVGLFAAALADGVGPTGSVRAVEADRDAVHHARSNLADRSWARVRRSRVDRAVSELTRRGRRTDLVVLDPPRTGAGRAVVRDVAALRPRLVAYVACDPAALARDLAHAREAGLGIRSLRAFDAFPMTHHVECIAVLGPMDAPG
jgi:tRNA/tmRNA/rRNA uracil-C5-methylase (TrmA/RlmC/RlmD family)